MVYILSPVTSPSRGWYPSLEPFPVSLETFEVLKWSFAVKAILSRVRCPADGA